MCLTIYVEENITNYDDEYHIKFIDNYTYEQSWLKLTNCIFLQ